MRFDGGLPLGVLVALMYPVDGGPESGAELGEVGDGGWRAAPIIAGLAIVLGGAFHDRLGVWTAPRCDRVYGDVSRDGTRRCCSTACQNRVKAAAFRSRTKVE